jgi:hypothetical protein
MRKIIQLVDGPWPIHGQFVKSSVSHHGLGTLACSLTTYRGMAHIVGAVLLAPLASLF